MHIHKLQCMYYNTCTYVHVTSARHYVRALNMKHTLEFVFIERYAMLFCSTYKMQVLSTKKMTVQLLHVLLKSDQGVDFTKS